MRTRRSGARGQRQGALDVDGAAQRGVGAGEGEQVAVAERLDQRSPVRLEAAAEQLLVLGQRLHPARLAEALEQRGRAFDVGEDDGDRSPGDSSHPSILTDQDAGDEGFTGRRATPLRVPASATAAATASATSRLNTLGMT